jgi:hypothetical protein
MGWLNNLADSLGVARNAYQGTPTFEKPASQGEGDITATLERYSGLADSVLSIFGGNDVATPTSQPKQPGSAVVTTRPAISPTVWILLAVAVVAGWFLFKKR